MVSVDGKDIFESNCPLIVLHCPIIVPSQDSSRARSKQIEALSTTKARAPASPRIDAIARQIQRLTNLLKIINSKTASIIKTILSKMVKYVESEGEWMALMSEEKLVVVDFTASW